MTSSSSIYVVTNGRISFFYDWIIIHWIFYVHTHTHTHTAHLFYALICHQTLGILHVVTIMNNIAVNMGVQLSLRYWFHFLWTCNLRWVVGWYRRSILISSSFYFFRKLHSVFGQGCANIHSHQPSARVSFPPHPPEHVLSLVFLTVTILTDERWYLTGVLTFIS